uniref:Uncharacterized protein n=1 Tax=Rhizophora mucronata TaxID=61149 RepID=A0A2P2P9L2_RHIMU
MHIISWIAIFLCDLFSIFSHPNYSRAQ